MPHEHSQAKWVKGSDFLSAVEAVGSSAFELARSIPSADGMRLFARSKPRPASRPEQAEPETRNEKTKPKILSNINALDFGSRGRMGAQVSIGVDFNGGRCLIELGLSVSMAKWRGHKRP